MYTKQRGFVKKNYFKLPQKYSRFAMTLNVPAKGDNKVNFLHKNGWAPSQVLAIILLTEYTS